MRSARRWDRRMTAMTVPSAMLSKIASTDSDSVSPAALWRSPRYG